MSEKLIAAIPEDDYADIRLRPDSWRGRHRIDVGLFTGPPAVRCASARSLAILPAVPGAVLDALKAARAEAIALGWLAAGAQQ
jgi:hypothetical protein